MKRPATLLAVAILSSISGGAAPARATAPVFTVAADNPDHVDLVRWALDRFDEADLDLPSMRFVFHADSAACGGPVGYLALTSPEYALHLCPVGGIDAPGNRFTLLHELGHAWVYSHLGPAEWDTFARYRGVSTWNDQAVPWQERGTEQAADLIALSLMDTEMTPRIPDAGPQAIERGLQLLQSLAV